MNRDNDRKEYGVYVNSMLSMKVTLSIIECGKNIKYILEKKIKQGIEGKCIGEGFVRPKTVEIVSYSSGLIKDDQVEFHVIYRCLVCNPVKDMEMDCVVNNITKAGIHAFVKDDDDNTPVTVFVARDHHTTDHYFESVQEKDRIRVRIIGIRYELHDPTITAIAALIKERVIRDQRNDQRNDQMNDLADQRNEHTEEPVAFDVGNKIPLVPAPVQVYKDPTRVYPDAPLVQPVAVVYNEDVVLNAPKRKIVINK